ncbi:helix-turn-helix domain-containing protein [Streptomyces acidiscabies]|uniref:Helix-turn-helix transcriptional regulator n=1 Tax=Streptomyces acidiscabies TaxID=42234 RepID=A0AAP6BLJ9_9ACTN|nr:helix-turn-helix transcriptional regulator [Streptomyces acidiscabies]MBP5938704.1 helix-turn-helix domain-containing protein [Streptomyces sp. LBUM 1476]MBZ3909816.1 helix-turn-helix domain-containing protein [Streptomyces acidiscabies]MDX2966915.1 helix-turn-helix transcriptional regulator [Streptomyces acidiscabies]MDX3026019.1 helix-turn-helix transcriptional regulator [Streptomyces acidiscabies]MDX3797019.1 helix-turn-helix transcriptional regulator [Streptomyces acidiscabies]
MAVVQRPTVRRRVLAANLRRLRSDRGLHLEHAAEVLSCDPSKISRIEKAESGIRQVDLKLLLDLYEIKDPEERAGWLALARESRERRWWRDLEDKLAHDFLDLVGLEEDVSHLRGFEAGLVHGLLQTRAYAEAVVGGGEPGPLSEVRQARVQVRMERQKALTRSERPLETWLVIGEAALRHEYGGRAVLLDQLRYLVELSELSNVTLQVLPFSAGAYRGGPYPFMIYRFPKPSVMEVVSLENHMGQSYLEKPSDIKYYGEAFDRLCSVASSPLQSQSLIRDLAGQLDS